MPTLETVLDIAFRKVGAFLYLTVFFLLIVFICYETVYQIKFSINKKKEKKNAEVRKG
jgi:hypothetical protein